MSSDELTTIAQKAARGGLFLFIGNFSSTIVMALGIILVARLLGPSSYGLYTLTLVIPSLLISLSDLGMGYALVRLPARLKAEGDSVKANRLIRRGFLLKLATSIVAFLICYFASTAIATTLLNRPELAPFLRIASLLIVFQTIFDAASNSFIGQDLMQYSASMQILQAILKGTLGPAFVLLGFGVSGAVLGSLMALAAAGLTGTIFLFTRHARSPGRAMDAMPSDLRELLGYGLPLYLTVILSVVLTQYQNIVLARLASNVEIGNFGATSNFTAFMMLLMYPITTAMFPMFSKMDPMKQRGDLARGFVLAVKYTSLVMIPASIAVMVFSRDLVYVTYGNSYALAPQYLLLLSVLYLLTGIGYMILGTFLTGVAQTRIVLKMSILTLAIYLPLGPALTWLWGPMGLLIAYILSNATSTVYGVNWTSVKFDVRPDLKGSGRILLAALVAAVPPIVLARLGSAGTGALNLAAGGGLYLVVYLTLAPVLGAVVPQDVSNLEAILCRTRTLASLAKPVLVYEARILSALGRV